MTSCTQETSGSVRISSRYPALPCYECVGDMLALPDSLEKVIPCRWQIGKSDWSAKCHNCKSLGRQCLISRTYDPGVPDFKQLQLWRTQYELGVQKRNLEVWNQLRRNAAAFYSSDRSLRQPLQRPGKNVPSEVLRGPKTAAVTSTTQTPGGSTGADQERITVERNTLSLIAEETPPVEFRKESEVVDLTQIGNTLAARNRASFWSSLPAQAFTRASSFAATTPRISAEEESDYDSDYDPNESRRPVTRLNRPSKRLKTKQETPNHITPPPLTPPLAQSPIRRTFKAPLSLPSSPPERQLDAISNRSEHQAEPVGLIGLLKTQLGAIMKHNSTMSRNQEAILQQLLELNRRQGEANLALKEVVAALKG